MNSKAKNIKKQTKLPQQRNSVINDSKNNQNKWIWYTLTIILITTFAVYFNAIKFDFLKTWDDNVYILDNNHIKDFNWTNIKLLFTNYYSGNYQPVSMILYALEYKIGAGSASVFHLNNIILHLLNTFLVFVLIKKISPENVIVALITAAFFAVHPMHVESVAWISERKDVLYSFFFLLSLIFYLNYIKTSKIKYLVFISVLYILSCMSKSAAVILPLAMLLFDYYCNRKYTWKLLLEKVPFFAISLVFGIVALDSQKQAVQNMQLTMTAVEHLSIVTFAVFSYLSKAIFPVNLSAIYTYPDELGKVLPVIYYLSILIVALLIVFVWYSRKWGKDVIFGFLFFIITIILVLQFIPVGAASMADRYTYIPYIGIFFMIGKLYEYLSLKVSPKTNFKKTSLVILILGFVSFSAITYARVKIWKNDDILFSDVINKYPNNASYRNRGFYFLNYYARRMYADDKIKRDIYLKKSISDYENSLKYPLLPVVQAEIYYALGTAKNDLGDYTNAITDLDIAINYSKNHPDVYYIADAYYNRGHAKVELKNDKSAIEDFNKTIELNPKDFNVFLNRGNSKFQLKDYNGAIEDYNKTIKLKPGNAKAYTNKGIAENELKNYIDAINDYNTAIKIDPKYAYAYYNRGNTKYILKNYEEAYEDYNKAVELDPQNANAVNNRNIVKSLIKK